MSATVTSQQARQPVTRLGGWIAGAIMVLALAALIGLAVSMFIRDSGPALTFDPTAAQRIHFVREYGSAASYDASGALEQHVVRENGSAPAAGGSLYDHTVRENGAD